MNFTSFIKYCQKHIKGDEKGEAQTFLDHFFTALGYAECYKGSGAEFEYRITTTGVARVYKNKVEYVNDECVRFDCG